MVDKLNPSKILILLEKNAIRKEMLFSLVEPQNKPSLHTLIFFSATFYTILSLIHGFNHLRKIYVTLKECSNNGVGWRNNLTMILLLL